jgi:hypothetical protein
MTTKVIEKKESNIPNITYKDFLKNQTPPTRSDRKYVDFWLRHINYCKSGVIVGGVYISGWLYWHINFFKITIDTKDEWGNPDMVIKNPDLRDNEWMIDFAHRKTDTDKKDPLVVVGTRRFAKTVFIASRIAYKSFIFQNSHAVIIGASSSDISNITKYFDEFYSARPDCFSDLMKSGDWLKSASDVEIIYSSLLSQKKASKTKSKAQMNPITPKLIDMTTNEPRYVFSRVAVRNLEHGQVKSKEELLAGITPTEVIWDEAGKYLFQKQRAALLPAIQTKFGKRTTEILVGTGGDIDNGTNLEGMFLYTEKSNSYHFDYNEYKQTLKEGLFPYEQASDLKVGVFVPAQMSIAGGEKIKIPFTDFLNKEFTKEEKVALEGFEIEVTNWENAKKLTDAEIEKEKEKGDFLHKKARMYYPYQPEDCFLSSSNSPFPTEDIKKMLSQIERDKAYGEYIFLTQTKEGIVPLATDKQPVMEYPYKGGIHDAPIIIYERPYTNYTNIERNVYVAGFDGYKIATSATTDSLGSLTIFKRMSGIQGVKYQIVATYASRPEQEDKFYRQCLLLLKYYNAVVLPERDSGFYAYVRGQNELKHFAFCKSLALGINPKANADYLQGLPATQPNQEFYMKLIQKYCNETIDCGVDENGDALERKGVYRIPDYMLLKELEQFGKHKNYDRIISFGHALAWESELSKNNILASDGTPKQSYDHGKFMKEYIAKRRRY